MLRGSARMVRHALIMMFGTCASRVLGLVREILIAAFFGATRQLDAFYVAYTLANLSRQLLAEGALSAAFHSRFFPGFSPGRGGPGLFTLPGRLSRYFSGQGSWWYFWGFGAPRCWCVSWLRASREIPFTPP